MENTALFGASLSDVRVTMVIMRVLVVELLCQVVIGCVPVLESLLPGTRGRLWLCLVLPDIEWPRFLRTPALKPLARYLGYPRRRLLGPKRMLCQDARVSLVWDSR
jgi:hypothetical protein